MSIDKVMFYLGDEFVEWEFVEWDLTDVNVLSGSNGSGKSSLLNAIATTEPYKNHVKYIESDCSEIDYQLRMLFHDYCNQIGGENRCF